MDLSIVILNYKTSGLVKQALRRLSTMEVSYSYEIVVADNASSDGCVDMVKENFPSVKTIQNKKNIGFGAGNNKAIQNTKGEYILILNPDVAVSPNEITKLYVFLQKRKDVSLVGPRLLNPDGSIQLSCFRFPSVFMPLYSRTFLKRFKKFKKIYDHYRMVDFNHAETIPVHWLVGGCMMIRKSDFLKVGMFDNRYFMYYEDIDLCRTLWKSGKKVYYHSDAEMVHYHQRLSAEDSFVKGFFNKTLYYHLSSWLKYTKKYLRIPTPEITK